jgi:hypothetical protein
MSMEYDFRGRLTFADAKTRGQALDAVRELLVEDDPDLLDWVLEDWKDLFMLKGDADLVVTIEGSGPSDWWIAFEGVVETLCAAATAGWIDVFDEDGDAERIEAGGA